MKGEMRAPPNEQHYFQPHLCPLLVRSPVAPGTARGIYRQNSASDSLPGAAQKCAAGSAAGPQRVSGSSRSGMLISMVGQGNR